MKKVVVCVDVGGTLTIEVDGLPVVSRVRVRHFQFEGLLMAGVARKLVAIARMWVRGDCRFTFLVNLKNHEPYCIEQHTQDYWFWTSGKEGGDFVIDCWCIDCGGTEPGHAMGCSYMRDLHGQVDAAQPWAQGGVLNVPKFLSERKLQGKGGSPYPFNIVVDDSAFNTGAFDVEAFAKKLTEGFDTVDIRLRIPEGMDRADFLKLLACTDSRVSVGNPCRPLYVIQHEVLGPKPRRYHQG